MGEYSLEYFREKYSSLLQLLDDVDQYPPEALVTAAAAIQPLCSDDTSQPKIARFDPRWPIEFVRRLQPALDWVQISAREDLSLEFVREFKDYLSMYALLDKPRPVEILEELWDRLNWYQVCRRQRLSEDFMRRYWTCLLWDQVWQHQEYSAEFVMEFVDFIDAESWKWVLQKRRLPEKFIEQHLDENHQYLALGTAQVYSNEFLLRNAQLIDWVALTDNHVLNEPMMRLAATICPEKIVVLHTYSNDFYREYANRLRWCTINLCSRLSEELLLELCDYVHWNRVFQCQDISRKFIIENIHRIRGVSQLWRELVTQRFNRLHPGRFYVAAQPAADDQPGVKITQWTVVPAETPGAVEVGWEDVFWMHEDMPKHDAHQFLWDSYSHFGNINVIETPEQALRLDKLNWTLTILNATNQFCNESTIVNQYEYKFDWSIISRSLSFYSADDDFLDKIDWKIHTKYIDLSVENLCRFRDRIDWDILCTHQLIPHELLDMFSANINWKLASRYQHLSPKLLEKYADKLDWDLVSRWQYLDWDYILHDMYGLRRLNYDLLRQQSYIDKDRLTEVINHFDQAGTTADAGHKKY